VERQATLVEAPRQFVQFNKVRKVYESALGPVEALSDVSFDVAPGEFISILGPSGCGKSTLLMMLAGLESISDGDITIDGQSVTGPRRETAVVFQDPTLLPWKTALENVLYPARLLKMPFASYRERAIRLLDQVGLREFQDRKPYQLSGGMRQRVALCRALALEPTLLLMDEPFSALDAITRDEMNAVLLNLWDSVGKTGVFVTHSIREAVLLSDRVLVMRQRPSTVITAIAVPFPRPRRMDLVDDPIFVALSAKLRGYIESGSGDREKLKMAALATSASR
jgi:NitT/TauT family transport system ATP-binding protein